MIPKYKRNIHGYRLEERNVRLHLIKVNVGRPPKYPYELLKTNLILFAKENKLGKINNGMLERFTGIPLYIWRDNKNIQEDIDRLNQDMIIFELVSNEIKELPNMLGTVERNYKNKSKVLDYLSRYVNLVNILFDKALLYDKTIAEKERIEIELKRVKEELNCSRKNEKMYREGLDRVMINSTSKKSREQIGIHDDMLDVVKNKELAGAVGKEMISKFNALFPDSDE